MEDNWKHIFNRNKDRIQEEFSLPVGHEKRFLDKLNQQNQKTDRPNFNYWKIAAVLIPLLMLSVYFWTEFRTNPLPAPTDTLAAYSPELSEAENHLSYLVEMNIKQIKSMETTENQQLIDNSLSKLDMLQKDYNRLLLDLKESGGNPQVMKSVLLNLQLQVKVLEQVLNQMNSIQEFKNNSNETLF